MAAFGRRLHPAPSWALIGLNWPKCRGLLGRQCPATQPLLGRLRDKVTKPLPWVGVFLPFYRGGDRLRSKGACLSHPACTCPPPDPASGSKSLHAAVRGHPADTPPTPNWGHRGRQQDTTTPGAGIPTQPDAMRMGARGPPEEARGLSAKDSAFSSHAASRGRHHGGPSPVTGPADDGAVAAPAGGQLPPGRRDARDPGLTSSSLGQCLAHCRCSAERFTNRVTHSIPSQGRKGSHRGGDVQPPSGKETPPKIPSRGQGVPSVRSVTPEVVRQKPFPR